MEGDIMDMVLHISISAKTAGGTENANRMEA